jgi:hypothetical protein
MDSLTEDNWNEVATRYRALDYAARDAAGYAAWDAARAAARDAAWDAAWSAARDATWGAAWDAARAATYELIGMHTLLNDGKTLMFVPLFDGLDNS